MPPELGNGWVDMTNTITLAAALWTGRNENDRRGVGLETRSRWVPGALREHAWASGGMYDKRGMQINPRNEWHAPMPPTGGLPQATRSAGGT